MRLFAKNTIARDFLDFAIRVGDGGHYIDVVGCLHSATVTPVEQQEVRNYCGHVQRVDKLGCRVRPTASLCEISSLTFRNDDSDDGPFGTLLPSGAVNIEINSIDVAGVEVAPFMRPFTFMLGGMPAVINRSEPCL